MVFVGQGTFGCVYRPPLKCKNNKTFGPNRISKLMVDDEAMSEINEYKLLQKIDPSNKYYPGPPNLCKADPNDSNISDYDCSLLEESPKISDYSLLFYKDGGIDLDDFVEDYLDNYLLGQSEKQTDLFFLNAHKLFKGIQLYINNNFLHHDIKPSNIVFNPQTYTFNFIDFGLAIAKDKLVNDIINKLDYESFHWSYPLELGFTNYKKDFYFENLNNTKIDKIEEDFTTLFKRPDQNKHLALSYKMKLNSYVRTTFRYMKNELRPINVGNMIKSTMNGLRYYKQQKFIFNKFVNDTVPFMDIYALGFTLNHVLNFFYKKKAITSSNYSLYNTLFSSMFDFDFTKRLTDMNLIMDKYENILKETGVLKRTNRQFVNHEIVDLSLKPKLKTRKTSGKEMNRRKTNRSK